MWFAHVVYCYIIQQCQVFVKSLFLNSAKKSIIRRGCGSQLCIAAPFSGRANPSGHTMTPPTIPRTPRLASPTSACVPQWSSSSFLWRLCTLWSIITAAGQTHGVSHDAPNNSHNSHNSHNSQTGVAQLDLRAAVVIKQLFWRLCTRGNGSWALKCCSKKYCLRLTFFAASRPARWYRRFLQKQRCR